MREGEREEGEGGRRGREGGDPIAEYVRGEGGGEWERRNLIAECVREGGREGGRRSDC